MHKIYKLVSEIGKLYMFKAIVSWVKRLFSSRSDRNAEKIESQKLRQIEENEKYLAQLRQAQMKAIKRKELDARLIHQQARIQKGIEDIHKEYEPVDAHLVDDETDDEFEDVEEGSDDHHIDRLFFDMFAPLIKGMIGGNAAGNGPNSQDNLYGPIPALGQQNVAPQASMPPQITDEQIRNFLSNYPKDERDLFKKMPDSMKRSTIKAQAPGISDEAIDRALKILKEEF